MAELDGRTEVRAGRNDDTLLLVSMTGMWPHVALLPATEICDTSRFAEPKNPVS